MLGPEEKQALKKAMGAIASGKMKPGDSMIVKGKTKAEPMAEEGGEYDTKEHLKAIMQDLLSAIENKDVDAMADLVEEAFSCCDAAPHVEGPHESE